MKYYLDETPFGYAPIALYDFLISSLHTNDTFIEVVVDVRAKTDRENRILINDLLNKKVDYFKSSQPFERTVSLCPFFIKETYNSVCFKYNLTSEIIDELSSTWRQELDETCIIAPFIVYEKNFPVLLLNFEGTVAYLGENELNYANSIGFQYQEYKMNLNEHLEGLPWPPYKHF